MKEKAYKSGWKPCNAFIHSPCHMTVKKAGQKGIMSASSITSYPHIFFIFLIIPPGHLYYVLVISPLFFSSLFHCFLCLFFPSFRFGRML